MRRGVQEKAAQTGVRATLAWYAIDFGRAAHAASSHEHGVIVAILLITEVLPLFDWKTLINPLLPDCVTVEDWLVPIGVRFRSK